MLNEKLFVVTETGNLWERHWRNDLNGLGSGRPRPSRQSEDGTRRPARAMLDEKLFVVTETGNLWERHWRSDLGRAGHGRTTARRPAGDSPPQPVPP